MLPTDKIISALCEELQQKHQCHSVILYGSHALGTCAAFDEALRPSASIDSIASLVALVTR